MSRTRWHLVANAVVLAWLTAAAVVGLAHRAVPDSRWLVVHLLALGGVTTAILVWSSHFTVTLLHLPPTARRAEGVRLVVLTAGVVAVVAGAVAETWPWAAVGSGLVAAAVATHVASLTRTLRRAGPTRFAVTVRFYVAAGLLLLVGVALGAALESGDLSEAAEERLVVAHLLLNLLGWVGLTVIGTLVAMWPMLLRTRMAPSAEADTARALPVLLVGVLVAAGGAVAASPWLAAGGLAVYLVGLVVTGRPLLDAARRKPPTAFPARSVLMGAVWLTGSIVVLVAQLAASGRGVDAARLGWVTPALLVGFAAQVLVGGLTFLTPVVLGGGPATARRTIAAAEQLAWPRLVATNAGLLLLVLPVPEPLRAAGRVLAVTGLAVTVPLLVHSAVVARRERLTRR